MFPTPLSLWERAGVRVVPSEATTSGAEDFPLILTFSLKGEGT
jgi:hypothetical protein